MMATIWNRPPVLPPGMRERVDEAHRGLNEIWYGDRDSRGCHSSEVRSIPVTMAAPAPAEQPKREIRPSFEKQVKQCVGLQTGKKSALTIGERGPVVVKRDRPGRIGAEPRDPATCTHFQNGKELWYKNGKGRLGQQKVICPACKRESRLVDGVVVDPGPYVAPKVPNPPADLPAFVRQFVEQRGVSYEDVCGPSRLREVADVRRELCVYLEQRHHMSNRQIAAAINKNNSTVQWLISTRRAE